MTRILSPVSNKDEIEPLAKAGADEFFFGFIPGEKLKESDAYLYLNRRATPTANFTSIDDVHEALSMISALDKSAYVTLNEHFYSRALYDRIFEILTELNLKSPGGVIVSDIGLIRMLKENFPQLSLVASTGCPVFNARSLAFYKDIGIERVTLSVALTVAEIRRLASAAKRIKIDMECFIKNENCINTNALCTYIHGWKEDLVTGSFCKIEKEYTVQSGSAEKDGAAAARLRGLRSGMSDGCGACFLPDFIDSGIQTVKIDGRTRSKTEKLKDLFFIKKLIELHARGLPPKAFREHTQRIYGKIYGRSCREKCIYS